MRLQQLRRVNNWRQADVCRLTGISAPSWTKYERGDELIPVHHAITLAIITDSGLDWIYIGRTCDLAAGLRRRIERLGAVNGDD